MFRLQNAVPSNYMQGSRDFQLLTRLYSLLGDVVRSGTDVLNNSIDPFSVQNNYLMLLASRVGFFPKRHIDDNTLRYIISAFSYIIKYKGTKEGVRRALATILKAEDQVNAVDQSDVTFTTTRTETVGQETQVVPVYEIVITIPVKLKSMTGLLELLRYVVPAGFTCKIVTGTVADDFTAITQTVEDDNTPNSVNNSVLSTISYYENRSDPVYEHVYTTTIIAAHKDEPVESNGGESQ